MSDESAYGRVGVDIGAGRKATELMAAAVKATYGPEVLAGLGAFGGLFDAAALQAMARPVLVASSDGVGTKTMVAAEMGRWDSVGQDLVNHCINDILVQGARPLFFLDYVASAQLAPETIATVVGGVARACQEAGCALLGGETAEMPGVYHPGAIDLVGTIIGVVERQAIIDGSRIQAGDAIIGLAASGIHTNGYTLARSALAGLDWQAELDELGQPPGEALLTVHRSYLPVVAKWQAAGLDIRGLAHITGGGLLDNPPRIFPDGLGATIWRGRWPEPAIFGLIQRLGNVDDGEMFHVFNMGLGMLAVIPTEQIELARETAGEPVYVVGEMVAGQQGVIIQQ